MTTTVQAATLVLRKRYSRYHLDETLTGSATLRARGGMRRGVVSTGSGTWEITVNDFWRRGVTLGSAEGPLVCLDPGGSLVPDGRADWSIGRTRGTYHGTVSRGPNRISVRQPAFFGRPIRVEVVGTWYRLDLVVLSACFAVISRRRVERLRAMAIAGAIGNGGG